MSGVGRLYVKLDVDYPDNPRLIAAGEKAEVLFIRALCLSKRTLSDGFIDERQLPRFGLAGHKARADALVREQLWDRVEGGYQIVGWLDRNKPADAIRAESEKRSEAGRAGGRASGSVRRGEAKPKQSASTNGHQSASGLLEHRVRDRVSTESKSETETSVAAVSIPYKVPDLRAAHG